MVSAPARTAESSVVGKTVAAMRAGSGMQKKSSCSAVWPRTTAMQSPRAPHRVRHASVALPAGSVASATTVMALLLSADAYTLKRGLSTVCTVLDGGASGTGVRCSSALKTAIWLAQRAWHTDVQPQT